MSMGPFQEDPSERSMEVPAQGGVPSKGQRRSLLQGSPFPRGAKGPSLFPKVVPPSPKRGTSIYCFYV